MLHSRPGFAPRRSDKAPSKLNPDMVPAIHRKVLGVPTPLRQIERTAREIAADILHEQMVAEALIAAQRQGPEILVNPLPSEPPTVLEPGK
jgi:hypothetical protein